MEGCAHASGLSAVSADDPKASSPFPSEVKIEPNNHSSEERSPPLNPMGQRKRISKSDCDCSVAPKTKKERSISLHLDSSPETSSPSSPNVKVGGETTGYCGHAGQSVQIMVPSTTSSCSDRDDLIPQKRRRTGPIRLNFTIAPSTSTDTTVKLEPPYCTCGAGTLPTDLVTRKDNVTSFESDVQEPSGHRSTATTEESNYHDVCATNLLPSSAAQTRSGIDDEVDMEGVSSYDVADAERNILGEMMGGGDGSLVAGVDLFSGGGRRSKKVLSHHNRADGPSMCSPFAGPSADQESTIDGASSYEARRNRMNASELSDASDSSSDAHEVDSDYVPVDYDSTTDSGGKAEGAGHADHASGKAVRKVRKTHQKTKFYSTIDDSIDEVFNERMRELNESEVTEKEVAYKDLGNSLKVSRDVWNRLYKYQKEGVVWMTELHEQYVGGILADEMGLGKTIQVITFLRAVDESQVQDNYMNFTGLGPSLVICPSTLLQQWVQEFHIWMPRCRVAILHSTGDHKGSKRALIRKMVVSRKGGSVLITTYTTFNMYKHLLLPERWHYVILDEGHKIRNPFAQTTVAVKQLHTPCRLILSGTPLQNSLKEIWSLMDFVYAGRLNNIDTFTEKFAIPITQGGYANATKKQLTAAYKCAVVLRDAISPYILRRMKNNVQKSLELPEKNEKVLFCEVSSEQRRLYLDYLSSRECQSIFKGRLDAFVGLTVLRKLCNHPDLITGGPNRHHEFDVKEHPTKAFGYYHRSGKMRVLLKLLRLWYSKGEQKVLLFSQSRDMLNIIERQLQNDNYAYLRMDGSTCIKRRQSMVRQFNEDPQIFVFLLTTKVGGIGVNLTAANKVIIFDPDWNPSTDSQAKERAWRIGQERAVTIYRLLCAGTIEEKVYHRQIFKQFLANRILRDPKQRQFFKTNDLHDLFSFSDVNKDCPTETGALFASETDEIRKENFFDSESRKKHRRNKKRGNRQEDGRDSDRDAPVLELSEDKKAALRERARRLARKLSVPQLSEHQTVSQQSTDEGCQKGHSEEAEAGNDAETESSALNKVCKPDSSEPNDENAVLRCRPQTAATTSSTESHDKRPALRAKPPEESTLQSGDDGLDMRDSGESAHPPIHSDASGESCLQDKSKRGRKHSNASKSAAASISSDSRKGHKATKTSIVSEEVVEKSDDDYVLGCLLKSAGVRCAIQHDDLVGEKPSDYLVEKEAAQVARAAANAICRKTNASFVRELRSRFPNPRKYKVQSVVPSKAEHFQGEQPDGTVFAAIFNRGQNTNRSGTSAVRCNDKNTRLAQKLRDFFVTCGGRAFTERITSSFQAEFEEDRVQFRAILRRIALHDLLKREWYLRDEYW